MPYSYVYQQVWDIPTGLAGYYSPSTIPTTAPAGGYIFNIAIESMPDYIVDIHQNVDFSIAC
jgi:hypothetical protein